jgi:predicted RNA-binding protein associated with RNAse of E/G family
MRADRVVVDRTFEGRDTWYVDLITVEQDGNTYTFHDLFVDVMVPMDGRHYRMLDLDEFADAIDSGVLSIQLATDALRRWQHFLDRHLHATREPLGKWTDFPPAAIRPLLELPLR